MYVGNDVIAQAQSGTGKTATFSISALQSIDLNVLECQALVLAPTRELAQQVSLLISLFLFCISPNSILNIETIVTKIFQYLDNVS